MTLDEAHDAYIAQDGTPHFKLFAATVGRFQEGLLADRVTDDLDVAFARAVDTTVRLLPVLKIKAAKRP
jgi:hypothetical protein